ncbi:MAG: thiamine diphosphokinase [Chloroflexi bacterium]|nr:thiamine diphosphokinase [Chloroflexota bacterium]
MSNSDSRHAVLVGDGDVPSRAALDAAWPEWDADVALVVAADGGAAKAPLAGLCPDLVVGDADSLDAAGLAAVRAAGIPVELVPAAKDESDLELAILAALARGATRITVLGALGGPRFDHALANAWLLAHPALAGRAVVLLDAATRIRLLDATGGPAAAELVGRAGDLVSLFAFGADAQGVSTAGLAYALRDEQLPLGPARGLSNVRSGPTARVVLRAGRLLVVETHAPQGDLP